MSFWAYIGILISIGIIVEGLGLSAVPSLNPAFKIEEIPLLSFSDPSLLPQNSYFTIEPAD
jgi:hypothetical protein